MTTVKYSNTNSAEHLLVDDYSVQNTVTLTVQTICLMTTVKYSNTNTSNSPDHLLDDYSEIQ